MNEILGLDDILGDLEGDEMILGDDLLGALLGGELRANDGVGRDAIKRAIQLRKLKAGNVLTKKDPSFSGVVPLGMMSNTGGVASAVAAGATVDIITQPQMAYRPKRLVVPETIAPFFTINDIKVGNRSQFPSNFPIPAEMFIPSAEDVDFNLETVNPAINLLLNVTNISGAPVIFRAGFKGTAVG